MNTTQILNGRIERVSWGLLAILWGVTFLFDFLPFATGLVGTGLILLGANLVRWLNQLPTGNDNTILGTLILAWGGLEFGRPWLGRLFPSVDLDWVIFALLLIGWGVIRLTHTLLAARDKSLGTPAGTPEE